MTFNIRKNKIQPVLIPKQPQDKDVFLNLIQVKVRYLTLIHSIKLNTYLSVSMDEDSVAPHSLFASFSRLGLTVIGK